MAIKSMLFLLASFLLLATRVSSKGEDFNVKLTTYGKDPLPAPPLVALPPAPAPVEPKLPPPKVNPPPSPDPKPKYPRTRIQCIPLCVKRCKLHSRKRLCFRACLTCCDRCKCVPPGRYGNRKKCGKCYTDMTTHGGRPKCP